MDVIDPTLFKQIPVYQMLNTKGELLCSPDEVQVSVFLYFRMFISLYQRNEIRNPQR